MRAAGFVAAHPECCPSSEALEKETASQLYNRFKRGGWWAKIQTRIAGGSAHLVSLSDVASAGARYSQVFVGLQVVPIDHICGSVNPGRANDFDHDFRPLRPQMRDRWVNLAAVWIRGRKLPPVVLIQFQDFYYVQDGHHRISVARAHGEKHIQAYLTVWQRKP